MSAILLAAAFAASYLGWALLALTQPVHRQAAGGQADDRAFRPGPPRALGSALLVLTAVLTVLGDGPAFGALLALLLLSAGAFAVAFTLSWQPRLLGCVAAIGRRAR
ncbi:DUF3325 family protein [Thauera chlorobenzoica]|uniref:Uncharacterized protein n=1 Tax=Thauera chlorobenzoica TaxID=96773 RepID=A0A1H5WQM4_9RHOO|nr:DUF3325 family protein [Thauera chlorobenzoica]APR04493.1 hypothetical protein Tchl_1635 [Thauera chlorobenzoica]SEG01802.1 Protein of unknown function [Thauera chlorobenzoica]